MVCTWHRERLVWMGCKAWKPVRTPVDAQAGGSEGVQQRNR
jgi:hypothetical protein